MRIQKCVGKYVLRTKENKLRDKSFTTNPILILDVTETHVFFKTEYSENSAHLLSEQDDDNWIIYNPGTTKIIMKDDIPCCGHCGMPL